MINPKYIIAGARKSDYKWFVAHNPRVHWSLGYAIQEASRLSRLHPESEYYVMKRVTTISSEIRTIVEPFPKAQDFMGEI